MRVAIYALLDESDYLAFDRAIPGAMPDSVWDDWSVVGVFECPEDGVLETPFVAEAYGDASRWMLAINGRTYGAQQVMCGEAPVSVSGFGEWAPTPPLPDLTVEGYDAFDTPKKDK